MNTKMKRRLGAVTGVIVIVVVLVLVVVGGNTAARSVTVAEAAELSGDSKIKVSGNVVENSFAVDGQTLTFQIYDPEADPDGATTLPVRYDGGVSATFGNDVIAICTGKKNAEGTLVCSELVTKCPSKYENASGSLSVSDLLGYGEKVIDKPVIVSGAIGGNGVSGVDADVRFTLVDPSTSEELPVVFMGAVPDDMIAGARVVLTGSIGADGSFTATNVAFEA